MIELLLNDARGIYIPRDFTKLCDMRKWHVKPRHARQLRRGPDHYLYWESWEHVLDHAFFIKEDESIWRLYQDGDLFAICDDITDEHWENFIC
jgi:hypothetical protein